jgi:hypothetical protein
MFDTSGVPSDLDRVDGIPQPTDPVDGAPVDGTELPDAGRHACRPEVCGDLGCCDNQGCEIVPSNERDVGELADEPSIVRAAGTFNTDDACTEVSSLGRCAPVEGAGGSPLCVCRMGELTIEDLEVRGARGLVLLASRTVQVSGMLRLAAGPGQRGPGSRRAYDSAEIGLRGGAGGSFGTRGGGDAADPFGPQELTPLLGGMNGQDACGGRPGGGGGGAVQISAGVSIVIAGTVTAPGGGGEGGSTEGQCLGGAGGGSGGAILLEAPAVSVPGTLATNGGGGGGGGSLYFAEAGSAGRPTASGAPGGRGEDGHGCIAHGYTNGGDGGAGAARDQRGRDGEDADSVEGCRGGTIYVGQGGGGGGVGRIRINARTPCACTGTFSPAATLGGLEVR